MAVQAPLASASVAGAVQSLSWREARRERKAAGQYRKYVTRLNLAARQAKHQAATTWHASRTLAGAVRAAEMLGAFADEHLQGDAEQLRVALEAKEHQGLYWLRAAREAVELALPETEIARLGDAAREALRRAAGAQDPAVHARSVYLLTCAHLRMHDLTAAEASLGEVLRLAVLHPFTRPQLERLQEGVGELRHHLHHAAA